MRVNGTKMTKRAAQIVAGDVLTFATGDHVRVIQVDQIGTRRGPAPEAQALYTDLSPPASPRKDVVPENPAYEGKGRPTKRDRRKTDLLRSRGLNDPHS